MQIDVLNRIVINRELQMQESIYMCIMKILILAERILRR